MAVTYVKGDVHTTQHTPSGNVASGDVVVLGATNGKRARIGIALTAIAANATGSVAITGCWKFPKVSTAAIKQGEGVGWDSSEDEVEDSSFNGGAAGDVVDFGMADSDAAALTTTVNVWIDTPGVLDVD
jgi:predicted RecA/RadA family phage recombinase